MYSDILSQIHTKYDSDALLLGLDAVKKAIYSKDGDLFAAVNQNISANLAALLSQKLAANSPDKYIEGLEMELKNMKLIKLGLAFMPTQKTVDSLFEWINTNLGEGFIVDIMVKPEILGGALIDCEGKYFDASLVKLVDEFFKTNSTFINERL